MKFRKTTIILAIILLGALFLRLYALDRADVITDESLIAFRAIGLIDFDTSAQQTTPWEWFSAVPDWARWSFHDQPPLVFWIEHILFKFFGVNLWSLRLPFVLAGVASVYLIYLIGRELFKLTEVMGIKGEKEVEKAAAVSVSEVTGLIAAGLMAVVSYPVWLSRIGLQESMVIFFILLSFYFFLKALDRQKYFYWLGASFGLGLLAKYTVIFLAPAFFLYLLFYRRDLFWRAEPWLASLLSLVVMLPIFVYNIGLYAARGHFDFQLSLLFGQNVPEWQFRLGRELAGGLADRLINFLPNLRAGLTPIMFYGSLAALVWFGFSLLFRRVTHSREGSVLLLLAIFFLLLELISIGPAERFLSMLVPFLILTLAWFIHGLIKKVQKPIWQSFVVLSLVVLFGYELLFTYNTAMAYRPVGQAGLAWSGKLKSNSWVWGYNELEKYLTSELAGQRPARQLATRFSFLEKIREATRQKQIEQGLGVKNLLIIYDSKMDDLAALWYLSRRAVYQGWPIITAELYQNVLEQEGENFYREQGIDKFIYISPTRHALLEPPEKWGRAAAALRSGLAATGLAPRLIKNQADETIFEIYEF